MKRILVVTGGFLPGRKYGGIVTSRVNFVLGLEPYYEIRVVTPNHDYHEAEPYDGITDDWMTFGRRSSVRYLSDRAFHGEFFSECLESFHPDLVYLSGTITSYFQYNRTVIRAAKERNIPVLITPDGDVCNRALEHSRAKKAAAIAACRAARAFQGVHFQVTLEEERENLIRLLGISPERITLVPNMPAVFESTKRTRKESGLLRVVFCARIHPHKNPELAIRAVKLCPAGVSLDLYGQIEDAAYWARCAALIGADAHRIRYCGALFPEAARTVCQDYDCSILPTKSENYCYGVEESLRCGCPAVISRGTTPWDGIDGVCGVTIPSAEPQAYAEALTKLARMDATAYARLSDRAKAFVAETSGMKDITERYHALFEICMRGGENA